MPYFYGIDITYIIFIIPALIFGLWAQLSVKSAFSKYSRVSTARGYTGAEVAKLILEQNGIYDVTIRHISGSLTDNFNPSEKTINLSDDVYATTVYSFTHQVSKQVLVSKRYLNPGDRVLIVDDFLANGAALEGLCDIVEQAGATVVGAAIAIEKAFQPGGEKLRARGLRIESLARIESMSDDSIVFCQE